MDGHEGVEIPERLRDDVIGLRDDVNGLRDNVNGLRDNVIRLRDNVKGGRSYCHTTL